MKQEPVSGVLRATGILQGLKILENVLLCMCYVLLCHRRLRAPLENYDDRLAADQQTLPNPVYIYHLYQPNWQKTTHRLHPCTVPKTEEANALHQDKTDLYPLMPGFSSEGGQKENRHKMEKNMIYANIQIKKVNDVSKRK